MKIKESEKKEEIGGNNHPQDRTGGEEREEGGGIGNIRLHRRQFLKGGIASMSALSVTGFLLSEAQAAGCITVSGAIDGTKQKRLEALMNCMLPGQGTHNTPLGAGVLDGTLYGKKMYAHLIDPYYAYQINQAELEAANGDLAEAEWCFWWQRYYDLSCNKQMGIVAFSTRRADEGPAPYLSWNESLCLTIGSGLGLVSVNPEKAFDLARLTALFFYATPEGRQYMRDNGYNGPNWGFNYRDDGSDWGDLPQPITPDLAAGDLECTNCSPAYGPWPQSIHPDTL